VKERSYQLKYFGRAQAKASLAYQNMVKSRIVAAAIHRTFQTFSQGHNGQMSQLLRSLQRRSTMANANANYFSNAYLNPVYGARAMASKAVMQTMTTAQALKEATSYFKAHTFTKAAVKAYYAKLNKKYPKDEIKGTRITKHTKGYKGRAGYSYTTGGGSHSSKAKAYHYPTKAQRKAYGKANYTAAQRKHYAQTAGTYKPPKAAKKRTARRAIVKSKKWVNGFNDIADTCVMTAICNRLIDLGYPQRDHDAWRLSKILANTATIEEGLELVCSLSHGVLHYELRRNPGDGYAGMIVGFEAETGPHAAYSFEPGKMVSWGEEMAMPDTIEEAWYLGR
jgi:hypothetical protein